MKGLFIKVNLQRSPKCESDKTGSPVLGTMACHVGGVEENVQITERSIKIK